VDINELFKIAVENKASDLHLVAGKAPIIRVDGVLKEIKDEPVLTQKLAQKIIFSLLSERRKEKFIRERDLDFSYEIKDLARFRINIHWEKDNVGLVARTIPSAIPTMEEILMPKITYQFVKLQQGLILVTGPTGCGKSTTLAAMIDSINRHRSSHIVTLEDPIEFIYVSKKSIIKQREIERDTLSFARGLKYVLRQDPNVILVGEMRDLETIAATLTAAETGHLVFSTLHTSNAAETVERIVDVFPPYQQTQIRLQLASTLQGIISQRLIPKINGGRIAAREILINTPAVANSIRENKIVQINTIIQTSASIGMITLDRDLMHLYKKGLISEEITKSYMRAEQNLGIKDLETEK